MIHVNNDFLQGIRIRVFLPRRIHPWTSSFRKGRRYFTRRRTINHVAKQTRVIPMLISSRRKLELCCFLCATICTSIHDLCHDTIVTGTGTTRQEIRFFPRFTFLNIKSRGRLEAKLSPPVIFNPSPLRNREPFFFLFLVQLVQLVN